MASPTYTADVLILRKTRLGESDCIIRMLDSNGCLLEGVAKGARKPRSQFSGKLELFNTAHVLAAKGRSLDIIKEARLLSSPSKSHEDPAFAAAASCICEYLGKLVQPELEVPRLYDLAVKSMSSIANSEISNLKILVASTIIKAASIIGMRPSTRFCVECGKTVEDLQPLHFSIESGGFVCKECSFASKATVIPQSTIQWLDYCIMSTLDDISQARIGDIESENLLSLADEWESINNFAKVRSINSLRQYCP